MAIIDDFQGNANISVSIKSGSTVTVSPESLHIRRLWLQAREQSANMAAQFYWLSSTFTWVTAMRIWGWKYAFNGMNPGAIIILTQQRSKNSTVQWWSEVDTNSGYEGRTELPLKHRISIAQVWQSTEEFNLLTGWPINERCILDGRFTTAFRSSHGCYWFGDIIVGCLGQRFPACSNHNKYRSASGRVAISWAKWFVIVWANRQHAAYSLKSADTCRFV